MLGAITGDIIGSVYERHNIKTKNFSLFSSKCNFTDDSVLTVALADAILNDRDYGEIMKVYHSRYPSAGYGASFNRWAMSKQPGPYNSWGNGSAMRTSPVGYSFDTLEEVLEKSKVFASFTHNHPEGVKGAQATSASIFLARNGATKSEIKTYVTNEFGYNLSRTIDEIRPGYYFDVSCQGSVPQAIAAFLESVNYEDAIRNAISIGGDSDTLACIAGGIAEAFYGGVPTSISDKAMDLLDENLRSTVTKFYRKYG
jgi:ADP-ribosylglycohydrolase